VAGYSGTPLAAKLGIKTGTALLAVGAPADYRNLLAPVPDGVAFASRLTARIDLKSSVHFSAARDATCATMPQSGCHGRRRPPPCRPI